MPVPTATPAPGPVKPDGYYHGATHGLALAQTARQPSESRDGWVDITLNLVAVKFSSGELGMEGSGESNIFCFEGAQAPAEYVQGTSGGLTGPPPSTAQAPAGRDQGPADCFSVKWGSTEQNEAQLRVANWESAGSSFGLKAVNFQVTFEVAANADKAGLFFGEYRIPLDLQGDYAPRDSQAFLPAPAAPPSQDAKTASFFMDSQHGIAVTYANRAVDLEDPLMSTVRVDLSVLALGEYDSSEPGKGPGFGLDDSTASVCFGKSGSECLEIFWGPENQFNAILTLEEGDADAFTAARRNGARWPLPVTVNFRAPANHDSAVLKFGEHEVPLDLRGMAGRPTFDYTAHYSEAAPGSVLYELDGKTVVLDGVQHNPVSGGIELSMTAVNDSEAADFAPVFIPDAVFSAGGRVEVMSGFGILGVDKLAPGQRASFRYVIPRAGARVVYSDDPEKRPDGVVFQVVDLYTPAADGSGSAPRAIPATPIPIPPISLPTLTPSSAATELEAKMPSLIAASESDKFHRDPQASSPAFVRFDRTPDEGKFWPVKILWWCPAGENPAACGEATPIFWGAESSRATVWDGVEYYATAIGNGKVFAATRESLLAMDADSGDPLWSRDDLFLQDVSGLAADNGVVYAVSQYWFVLDAFDAAEGELLWTFVKYGIGGAPIVEDGVVYVVADGYLYALLAKP